MSVANQIDHTTDSGACTARWKGPAQAKHAQRYRPNMHLSKQAKTLFFHTKSDTTSDRLQNSQNDKKQVLILKLEKEFEDKKALLEGADVTLLRGRAMLVITELLSLHPAHFSLNLTADQSIYGRAHLAAGLGVIHLELLFGEDIEKDDDTFITLYRENKQSWALGGEFRSTMAKMRQNISHG